MSVCHVTTLEVQCEEYGRRGDSETLESSSSVLATTGLKEVQTPISCSGL